MRKPLDVIEVGNPLLQRPEMHIRFETVDRYGDTRPHQIRHHGLKSAYLFRSADVLGIRVARRCPHIKPVGTVRHQRPPMRQCRGRVEIATAIGKGIRGDVENAEKHRRRHGRSRIIKRPGSISLPGLMTTHVFGKGEPVRCLAARRPGARSPARWSGGDPPSARKTLSHAPVSCRHPRRASASGR